MASKPFISARIPEALLERLEAHVDATGESKSSILIDALAAYLDADDTDKPKTSNLATIELERRMRYFERWIVERLALLEDRLNTLEEAKYSNALTVERSDEKLIERTSSQSQLVSRRRLMPGP